jgi:aryl-alcohol dehydrogenase-like predicted oxidoreductase
MTCGASTQNSNRRILPSTSTPCASSMGSPSAAFRRRVVHLSVRWMLDQGISVALWGGRRPAQVDAALGVAGWSLSTVDRMLIERIMKTAIGDPVDLEIVPPLQRAQQQK